MPQVTFMLFQGIYTNINRILSEAGELIKGGHYAAAHVRGVAARLDKAWKEFAGGLDERTTVLALSVMFHQKAEQVNTMQRIGDLLAVMYSGLLKRLSFVFIFLNNTFVYILKYVENVPKWGEQCEIGATSTSAPIVAASGISDLTRSTASNTSENSQQDINTLESTIHHHQSLYESMCQVITFLFQEYRWTKLFIIVAKP